MSEDWSERRWAILCFVIFVVGMIIGSQAKAPLPPPEIGKSSNLEVVFTGLEQKVIQRIYSANNTIYIAANIITNPNIATALLGAKGRAVNVTIIIEEENAIGSGTQIQALQKELRVILDIGAGRLLDTFMIIDSRVVVTGTYQWTTEPNTGDLVIIRDPRMAQAYFAQWNYIYETRRR